MLFKIDILYLRKGPVWCALSHLFNLFCGGLGESWAPLTLSPIHHSIA